MDTMKCLVCGHGNAAGGASCASCAAPLQLKLCGKCEALLAEDAARCNNCGTERSLPSAWLISGEPGAALRGLRAALWMVPIVAVAAVAAYQASSGLAEAQAVPVASPVASAVEAAPASAELKVAPALAAKPLAPEEVRKVLPRVTHTRHDAAAASGGSTQ